MEAIFINSSQGLAERGKTKSKRSGLNEEGMATAMADEEERFGEATAGRTPDKSVKVASMETFTFCSFKGGTSKTSAAMHVGAGLAKFHNKKVLLIDFDSQANLSIGLGIGPDHLKTMVPVLEGQLSLKEVIHPTSIPGLSLVPANAYLDGIERTPQLGNDPYAHERLRRALKDVKAEFDFCFIDTPPSLGWLTQSAFFASQHSLICAIPEAYSVIALRRLKEFQASIRQYHEIGVFGVILSFWDDRGAVNQAFLEEIENSFPSKVFQSKVRRDMGVSRAVLKGQTVFETDRQGRAASDYRLLIQEFLERHTPVSQHG